MPNPKRDARLTQSGESSVDRNSEAWRCGTGFQPVNFMMKLTGRKPVPQSKREGGGGRKRQPSQAAKIPERDEAQGSIRRRVGLNTRLAGKGLARGKNPEAGLQA